MLDRRCDDNRIQAHTVEQVLEVGHSLDVRVQASHVLQTRFADVAHRFKMTIGQPFEVADQIGSPISAPDNTHCDWLFHSTALDRSEVSRLLLILTTFIISIISAKAASVRGQAPAPRRKSVFFRSASLHCLLFLLLSNRSKAKKSCK